MISFDGDPIREAPSCYASATLSGNLDAIGKLLHQHQPPELLRAASATLAQLKSPTSREDAAKIAFEFLQATDVETFRDEILAAHLVQILAHGDIFADENRSRWQPMLDPHTVKGRILLEAAAKSDSANSRPFEQEVQEWLEKLTKRHLPEDKHGPHNPGVDACDRLMFLGHAGGLCEDALYTVVQFLFDGYWSRAKNAGTTRFPRRRDLAAKFVAAAIQGSEKILTEFAGHIIRNDQDAVQVCVDAIGLITNADKQGLLLLHFPRNQVHRINPGDLIDVVRQEFNKELAGRLNSETISLEEKFSATALLLRTRGTAAVDTTVKFIFTLIEANPREASALLGYLPTSDLVIPEGIALALRILERTSSSTRRFWVFEFPKTFLGFDITHSNNKPSPHLRLIDFAVTMLTTQNSPTRFENFKAALEGNWIARGTIERALLLIECAAERDGKKYLDQLCGTDADDTIDLVKNHADRFARLFKRLPFFDALQLFESVYQACARKAATDQFVKMVFVEICKRHSSDEEREVLYQVAKKLDASGLLRNPRIDLQSLLPAKSSDLFHVSL